MTWAKEDMKIWRIWVLRQFPRGFPSKTILANIMQYGLRIGLAHYENSITQDDNQGEQINTIIEKMDQQDRQMLIIYYLSPGKHSQKYRKLGITEQRYYKRFNKALERYEKVAGGRESAILV